jgi:hypothetical protein
MNLSVRDRKRLWAKAGNRCSYRLKDDLCTQSLVPDGTGKDVVVGQECHIVGDKQSSARYVVDFPNRDSYENAILLCPTHHRIVDDDEHMYTVEVLHQMKSVHEAAVASASKSAAERIDVADSEFITEVAVADRAVGMEVNRPASLTNVRSTLKATNVKEAIGFSTNQQLTVGITSCPHCGGFVPSVHTGPPPPSVRCPHCGRDVPIS